MTGDRGARNPELARERCTSATAETPLIGRDEATELKAALSPEWQLGETSIERHFDLRTFNAAFGMATRVALLAEAQGHHPDLAVGYGRLDILLTTHAIGGLSRNDFIMAAKIDRLAAD